MNIFSTAVEVQFYSLTRWCPYLHIQHWSHSSRSFAAACLSGRFSGQRCRRQRGCAPGWPLWSFDGWRAMKTLESVDRLTVHRPADRLTGQTAQRQRTACEDSTRPGRRRASHQWAVPPDGAAHHLSISLSSSSSSSSSSRCNGEKEIHLNQKYTTLLHYT